MRPSLFYNPRVLVERLAIASRRRRRLSRLRRSPARGLQLGYIDSLELLELLQPFEIATIYDVGANVGTWSLLAKSIFLDSKIEAFEPLRCHADSFLKEIADVSGVNLHTVALGAHNVDTRMHVTDFSDASSVFPLSQRSVAEFGLREKRLEDVRLNRLDDFVRDEELQPADLIKLDVQGYELEVLRRATGTIASAKAIPSEVSFVELYQGQCLFHELVEFLASHGFHVRAFGTNTASGKLLSQTDLLFLRSGLTGA